jgi:hypothetical protein
MEIVMPGPTNMKIDNSRSKRRFKPSVPKTRPHKKSRINFIGMES